MSAGVGRLLDAALAASRAAGAVLLTHREQGLEADWKSPIEPVSAADVAAEVAVRDVLSGALPGVAVVGEEGGGEAADGEPHWLVDPLDGTTNFLKGFDHFAVSIAHVDERGRTDVAVVAAPARGVTYLATEGGGAWRVDGGAEPTRLTVRPCDRLDRALVATGFPYRFGGADNLAEVVRVIPSILSPRVLGAAALDLCMVADGVLDAFWEYSLEPWDTAAGMLIAREAGAVVSDPSGRELLGPARHVVAASVGVHADLLALLTPAGPSGSPTA